MNQKFDDWLHRKFVATWVGRTLKHLFGGLELMVMKHYCAAVNIKMIQDLRKEADFLFIPSEIFHIYSLARAAAKLSQGDFAEVGVYNGTSAKAICYAKGGGPFVVFV